MVENSSYGSGEGPGWETGPGYSTGRAAATSEASLNGLRPEAALGRSVSTAT